MFNICNYITHQIFSLALGRVWLAGTLGDKAWKKFSKKQIIQENIKKCCNKVEEAPEQLAISTLGILLYGTCRIHEQQTSILLKDSHQTYQQLIRFARQTISTSDDINLPLYELQAEMNDITLPEITLDINDIGDIELSSVVQFRLTYFFI